MRATRESADAAPRVLLMGYRAGVARALRQLGVPFAIWNEKSLKAPPAGVPLHVASFGRQAADCKRLAEAFGALGPFTHVIAGTEAAVVPASYARRALGARSSVHTTVRRCHDKLEMKRELARHDIPMTEFVDGNQTVDPTKLPVVLGDPVVVKDRGSSGGRGVEIVPAENAAATPKRNRILERFVDAPEASVESFVHDGAVVFDNATQYYRKGYINVMPAADDDQTVRSRALSRRVIEALRIQWGMTHLETYLRPDGPLFGEIALRPPGGYLMELFPLAYGFDAWQAFAAVELGQPFEFPAEPRAAAAAIVLHPGAGRVRAIEGLDAVRAHPAVVRARLRVRVGDRITERTGLGADVGHVLLRAPDRDALVAAVDEVDALLRIDNCPLPG